MTDSTIDELLEAIEAVRLLRDTIGKHEKIIELLAQRLESVEAAVDALKTGASGTRR